MAKNKAAANEAAGEKAKAERAPRIGKAEVERIYDEQGGKSWISGVPLHPMRHGSEWHISDGRAITDDERKLKGGRSWNELRDHIGGRMQAAVDGVAEAKQALGLAEQRERDTRERFAGLIGADGKIRFDGEKAAKVASEKPGASAGEAGAEP